MRVFRAVFSVVSYCATIPESDTIRKVLHEDDWTFYMMNPYRHMELLAPAGSMTCLHAAVAAGADAVYLGCDAFNARRSADNFTLARCAPAYLYADEHA